jgi:Arc/MetJ family transcription regulator
MRTTLDIDRELLERATAALGASSYTEAIEVALRQVIARSDAREAWAALKGAELSWKSVDSLLEYRRRWGGRSL